MDTEPARYRDVLGNREYRSLWLADLFSIIGSQSGRVALGYLVLLETNSAALTGLAFGMTYGGALLGGILLSSLADRFPRRAVLILADLVRAALMVVVAIPGVPISALCVLVGLVSFVEAPFKAGQMALIADVLPGRAYLTGLAVRSMTNQTGQIALFPLVGLALTVVEPRLVLLFNAVTFVLSGLVTWIGVRPRPAPDSAERSHGEGFVRSAVSGAHTLFANGARRALLAFGVLSGLFIVYEGLAVPYARELSTNTIALGILLAADPIGAVLGSILWTKLIRPHWHERLLSLVVLGAGAPLLVSFAHPGLAVAAVSFLIAGVCGAVTLLQATNSLVDRVSAGTRAQSLGLLNAGMNTVQGIGPLLGGVIADRLSTATAVGIMGAVGILLAIPPILAWQLAQVSERK
ncbi:MFS transporter [Sciscionella sediminilitoris]|uniref:MFS transporter n=1 Tax=Sciscionella sediminilitoris TaxID=1445613 RepID=UPI0004DF6448|nr:MFS transporter [Sciscionella sp. SE31]